MIAIYGLHNIAGDIKYVGKASNLRARFYAHCKIKMSLAHKGRKFSETHVQNARLARKDYRHTEETKEKIRLAGLGRKQSKETIAKRSASNIGKHSAPKSLETRRNMSLGTLEYWKKKREDN